MSPLLALLLVALPADTTRFIVLNHGRPAGEMLLVTGADSVLVRYHHVDRNRGPRLMSTYRISPRGEVLAGESRPLDAEWRPGPLSDRYRVVDGQFRYGRNDSATSPNDGAFYRLRNATVYDDVLLARHLLRRPDRSARTLPGGTARLETAGDTTVTWQGRRLRVRLYMLFSRFTTPRGVWLDDRGDLFATEISWFITLRPGAAAALPALRAVELRYRARQADVLARRLAPSAPGVTAIVNGDVFDSERALIRPRHNVIVRGGVIEAVGPFDSVPIPEGATVIDATGRTVIPGLYEMHGHLATGYLTGPALWQLAGGVTTLRDLASDPDVAVSIRDRARQATVVSPRIILGGFIEGPGRWAGPSEAIARNEDEARAWVARYDSLGYRQIKLYNLLHPDFVPTIAAEARARGLRLSGHVPRGLSVEAAVNLGFDEINHSAFLFSNFFQDSLYTPVMRAYSLVAQAVAPAFDVDGAPMTALIAFLRARGTVVDGTFSLWARAPAPGSDSTDAGSRAFMRLAKRLFDAGVTMVAGTDNGGANALNVELELYERAGIPAASLLQMATLTAARVMREAAEHGAIAPGRAADLVIVNGRPHERIADLRNVERVMRAGKLFDPGALREAAGLVSPTANQATEVTSSDPKRSAATQVTETKE